MSLRDRVALGEAERCVLGELLCVEAIALARQLERIGDHFDLQIVNRPIGRTRHRAGNRIQEHGLIVLTQLIEKIMRGAKNETLSITAPL